MFLKIAQGSAKKNRKYFPKKEKISTFDSSGSKEIQESGTITLKSSFTLLLTDKQLLNSDRSLVFSLVGRFCLAPKLCDCWETCQT